MIFKSKTTDFVPFLQPANKKIWLLKNFSLCSVGKLIPLPAEGMDRDFWDNFTTRVGRLFFQNEIFNGITLTFNMFSSLSPDFYLLNKFKEQLANPHSTFIAQKIESFNHLKTREYYVGILVPCNIDHKLSEKKYEKAWEKFEKRVNNLTETFFELFDGITDQFTWLNQNEAFKVWYKQINPYRTFIPEPLFLEDIGKKCDTIPPPICNQLVLSGVKNEEQYIYYDGIYYSALSLLLPPNFQNSNELWQVLHKINCQFRFQVAVTLPESQHKMENKLNSERNLAKFLRMGASKDHNNKKIEAITNFLNYIKTKGETIVNWAANIIVSGKTEDELSDNVNHVISLFSGIGIELIREDAWKMDAYFAWSLPGLGHSIPWPRFFLTSSRNAARFLPILGEFTGERNKPDVLFQTRQNSLLGFSLFSEKQSKYGAIIIAPSGSGKSFLINNIINYYMRHKIQPVTAIIDMALKPSYQFFVEAFGGQSYIIDTSGKNIVNPLEFMFPFSMPPNRHYAFLREVFFPLIIEDYNPMHAQLLERALHRLYKNFLDLDKEPRKIEISKKSPQIFWSYETWLEALIDLKKRFLKSGEKKILPYLLIAHSMSMPTLGDLYAILSSDTVLLSLKEDKRIADEVRRFLEAFISSTAGGIFDGTTSWDAAINYKSNLYYMYLGDLVNYPRSLSAAFLTVNNFLFERLVWQDSDYQILSQFYGEDFTSQRIGNYKIFAIDEVHNLRHFPDCYLRIERMYRQGRTLGLAPLVISQGLSEITDYESGRAMYENTALKIFLRHATSKDPNKAVIDYVAEKTGFNKEQTRLLSEIERNQEYSEFLVVSEGMGSGVGRFCPIPVERWTNTTNSAEMETRNRLLSSLIKKGWDRKQAFDVVVEKLGEFYPNGLDNKVLTIKEQEKILRACLEKDKE